MTWRKNAEPAPGWTGQRAPARRARLVGVVGGRPDVGYPPVVSGGVEPRLPRAGIGSSTEGLGKAEQAGRGPRGRFAGPADSIRADVRRDRSQDRPPAVPGPLPGLDHRRRAARVGRSDEHHLRGRRGYAAQSCRSCAGGWRGRHGGRGRREPTGRLLSRDLRGRRNRRCPTTGIGGQGESSGSLRAVGADGTRRGQTGEKQDADRRNRKKP